MAIEPDFVTIQSTALYSITSTFTRFPADAEVPQEVLNKWHSLAISTLASMQEYGETLRGDEQRQIRALGNKIIQTFMEIEFPNKNIDNTRKDVLRHLFAPRKKNGEFSRDPNR